MDPQPPIHMTPPPQPPLTVVSAATIASTTEPILNHTAQVANPTPQHAATTPTPTQNHPPYAEMITAAITALKERNGSSKTAIAKYIEQVYTNLPSTHSALLTHHLKRLKNSGQLVMVKHSYKLPPSRSDNNVAIPADTVVAASTPPPTQPTKRPGRPPKPKPNFVPPTLAQDQVGLGAVGPKAHNLAVGPQAQIFAVGPQDQSFAVGPQDQSFAVGPHDQSFAVGPHDQSFAVGPAPVAQKRKPGRPSKPKPGVLYQAQNTSLPPPPVGQNTVVPSTVVTQNYDVPPVGQINGPVLVSEAVFASLGLADGPVATPSKRRPGRPRKEDSANPSQPRTESLDESGPKRKPGRPPKNWAGPNGVASVGSVSGRPRGRPKKGSSANRPAGNGQPKKRGRRPKNLVQASPLTTVSPTGVVAPSVEASAAFPGAVIVPYAQGPDAVPGSLPHAPLPVPLAVNGVPPPAAGKRRGRPPRANGGPRTPRSSTGRPVGRPKKSASSHGPSQHTDSFINLKRKLEYLQLRIKQTVSVLKPAIEGGTSASAMGALQQLEELATVGVNEF